MIGTSLNVLFNPNVPAYVALTGFPASSSSSPVLTNRDPLANVLPIVPTFPLTFVLAVSDSWNALASTIYNNRNVKIAEMENTLDKPITSREVDLSK